MARRVALTAVVTILIACALPAAPVPDEKKHPEEAAEAEVRLRLIGIESAQLLDQYGVVYKRELNLQDSVRACARTGDPRLAEYQQVLKDAQADLEKVKKGLVSLELERAKLLDRLGRKAAPEGAAEPLERANRTLEKILDRLGGLDKRLEKIERQR